MKLGKYFSELSEKKGHVQPRDWGSWTPGSPKIVVLPRKVELYSPTCFNENALSLFLNSSGAFFPPFLQKSHWAATRDADWCFGVCEIYLCIIGRRDAFLDSADRLSLLHSRNWSGSTSAESKCMLVGLCPPPPQPSLPVQFPLSCFSLQKHLYSLLVVDTGSLWICRPHT